MRSGAFENLSLKSGFFVSHKQKPRRKLTLPNKAKKRRLMTDHWRLSLRKIHCGIIFMSKFITSMKMWSFRRHSVSASASHTNNILSWCSKFNWMSCLIDGVGISRTIRKCPQLSCLSLVHCIILVVGGPLMTVKSPLQLTRRSIVVFLRFLYSLEVQSYTKNG